MRGRLRVRRGGKIDDSRMYWVHQGARRQGPLDRLLARPRPPARGRRPPRPGQRGLHGHAQRGGRGLTPLLDEIRSACARVAAQAQHVRIVERRDRALRAHAAAAVAARAGHRGRVAGGARRVLAARSTRSTSAPAGSRRCASRPGLSGFRTIEAGLRARGPWTAAELPRSRRAEVAAHVRAGPRARADGALRARAARARRPRHGRVLRALPRARAHRRGLGRAAGRDARRAGRRGRTSRPTRASAVPFYKRAQIAAADLHLAGIAPARRPRPPDAVRRQPRPARPAARRRARVRRAARRPHRRRLPARARLARGGRDPRLRAARGRAAGRGAPRPQRRRSSTTSSGTAAALPRYKARPRHRARTTAY